MLKIISAFDSFHSEFSFKLNSLIGNSAAPLAGLTSIKVTKLYNIITTATTITFTILYDMGYNQPAPSFSTSDSTSSLSDKTLSTNLQNALSTCSVLKAQTVNSAPQSQAPTEGKQNCLLKNLTYQNKSKICLKLLFEKSSNFKL